MVVFGVHNPLPADTCTSPGPITPLLPDCPFSSSQDMHHNFHIAMPMRAQIRRHPHHIIVEHPQSPPVHIVRVVVIAEGKMPVRIEPAMIGMMPRV
jgi:hypothetical protein